MNTVSFRIKQEKGNTGVDYVYVVVEDKKIPTGVTISEPLGKFLSVVRAKKFVDALEQELDDSYWRGE